MKQTDYIDISKFTEDQAREYLESIRWANGRICPHCKSEKSFALKAKEDSKHPVRKGVYKCSKCRKQFTVTVGTIFADSHIPLSKWLMSIYLMCSSKKGISANQLHRMLGITYKSAWFMAHRIRYAMAQTPTEKLLGIIEVDETYIGGKGRAKRMKKMNLVGRTQNNKIPVVALVKRGGDVRSKVVPDVKGKTLKEFVKENVNEESWIMTDEWKSYMGLDKHFANHMVIKHQRDQYVKDGYIFTNTIEGYFSLLKRGIMGTFHQVSRQHLHRYLSEFDFRYNLRKLKDENITPLAILGFEGKRLLYSD